MIQRSLWCAVLIWSVCLPSFLGAQEYSSEFEALQQRYIDGESNSLLPELKQRLLQPELESHEREALQGLLLGVLESCDPTETALAEVDALLAAEGIPLVPIQELRLIRIRLLQSLLRVPEALQELDALEQDPELDSNLRRSLRWSKISVLMGAERWQEALALADQSVDEAEDEAWRGGALSMRASIHEQLGNHAAAQRDRDEFQSLYPNLYDEYADETERAQPSVWLTGNGAAILQQWFVADPFLDLPLRAGVVLLVLTLIYSWIGNRQRREASGSYRRLFCVAFALAVATCGPTLIVWTAGIWLPLERLTTAFTVMTIGSTWLLWLSVQFLKPPVSWIMGREALPQADPELTAEAQRLTNLMGVPPLTVRLLPSLNAVADAYAGGLVAPSLVVGDGILQRFTAEERSGVLAHEIGHVANRSLPLLAFARLAPVWCAASLAVWANPGVYVMAWAMLLGAGLLRLVSRVLEYDCDRRAAQAVGVPTMLNALSKIHMVHPLKNEGVWSYLAYATATHPSRDERLEAVASQLPAEADIDRTLWNPRAARGTYRLAWVMAGLWLLILSLAFLPVSQFSGGVETRFWMTLLAFLSPWLFMFAARRKDHINPAAQQTKVWPFLLLGASLGVLLAIADLDFSRIDWTGILVVVPVIIGLIWLLVKFQTKSAYQVIQLIQQRRFEEAVALAEKSARKLKNQHGVRHDVAIVRFLLRQDKQAFRDLRDLREDAPKLILGWRGQAMFFVELGKFEKAHEILAEVADQNRKNLEWTIMMYEVLLRLNRQEEALPLLEYIRQQVPDSPLRYISEASWARVHQQADKAWEMINEADRLAPGEAGVACAKLRIAVELGPEDRIPELIAESRRLVEGNPFCLCQRRLERLEAEWQARQTATELEFVE